eukprot:766801-Rhodomonas_salina.1
MVGGRMIGYLHSEEAGVDVADLLKHYPLPGRAIRQCHTLAQYRAHRTIHGSAIPCLSTGHRVVPYPSSVPFNHTLAQYWASRSTPVAPCTSSVPNFAYQARRQIADQTGRCRLASKRRHQSSGLPYTLPPLHQNRQCTAAVTGKDYQHDRQAAQMPVCNRYGLFSTRACCAWRILAVQGNGRWPARSGFLRGVHRMSPTNSARIAIRAREYNGTISARASTNSARSTICAR